jgi:cholesterol transport system auxiliary component
MKSARSLKLALVALTALSASACVSLLPESEPNAVYRLSSPEPREMTGGDWTLVRVDPLQAPRGLAGDDVALLMEGRHLAYMQGAQWISPTPRIMQNLVIDTFNAHGSQLAPVRPEDGVRAEYELRLDLREFEAAYDQGAGQAPTVRVRIAARLISADGRDLVGGQVFTAHARASANRSRAIIDAFDQAAGQATRDLATWTAEITSD